MKVYLTFEIPDELYDVSDQHILKIIEGYKYFGSIKLVELKRPKIK